MNKLHIPKIWSGIRSCGTTETLGTLSTKFRDRFSFQVYCFNSSALNTRNFRFLYSNQRFVPSIGDIDRDALSLYRSKMILDLQNDFGLSKLFWKSWVQIILVRFFYCNIGDTVQYHSSLRSRELGQAPMLQVLLTPKQALSSHLCQTDGLTVLATG